jgi:7-keto-8-aminopelargonate synthetase-like enzyme
VTTTKHQATLRQIEQEEDQRQRLQQLRELHQAALRRHGLGHLANAKPGDRPLPLAEVTESGYWLVESE